jgi:hypothetical protein
MASSYGTISSFDTKSGEEYWVEEFDEGFYSSPIIIGDLVYAIDIDGITHIFKASKEFELVSRAELGESVVTVPAVMDKRLFIRGAENLYCIGEK